MGPCVLRLLLVSIWAGTSPFTAAGRLEQGAKQIFQTKLQNLLPPVLGAGDSKLQQIYQTKLQLQNLLPPVAGGSAHLMPSRASSALTPVNSQMHQYSGAVSAQKPYDTFKLQQLWQSILQNSQGPHGSYNPWSMHGNSRGSADQTLGSRGETQAQPCCYGGEYQRQPSSTPQPNGPSYPPQDLSKNFMLPVKYGQSQHSNVRKHDRNPSFQSWSPQQPSQRNFLFPKPQDTSNNAEGNFKFPGLWFPQQQHVAAQSSDHGFHQQANLGTMGQSPQNAASSSTNNGWGNDGQRVSGQIHGSRENVGSFFPGTSSLTDSNAGYQVSGYGGESLNSQNGDTFSWLSRQNAQSSDHNSNTLSTSQESFSQELSSQNPSSNTNLPPEHPGFIFNQQIGTMSQFSGSSPNAQDNPQVGDMDERPAWTSSLLNSQHQTSILNGQYPYKPQESEQSSSSLSKPEKSSESGETPIVFHSRLHPWDLHSPKPLIVETSQGQNGGRQQSYTSGQSPNHQPNFYTQQISNNPASHTENKPFSQSGQDFGNARNGGQQSSVSSGDMSYYHSNHPKENPSNVQTVEEFPPRFQSGQDLPAAGIYDHNIRTQVWGQTEQMNAQNGGPQSSNKNPSGVISTDQLGSPRPPQYPNNPDESSTSKSQNEEKPGWWLQVRPQGLREQSLSYSLKHPENSPGSEVRYHLSGQAGHQNTVVPQESGSLSSNAGFQQGSVGGPHSSNTRFQQSGVGGPHSSNVGSQQGVVGGPHTSNAGSQQGGVRGPYSSNTRFQQSGVGGPHSSNVGSQQSGVGGPHTSNAWSQQGGVGGPHTSNAGFQQSGVGGPHWSNAGSQQGGVGGPHSSNTWFQQSGVGGSHSSNVGSQQSGVGGPHWSNAGSQQGGVGGPHTSNAGFQHGAVGGPHWSNAGSQQSGVGGPHWSNAGSQQGGVGGPHTSNAGFQHGAVGGPQSSNAWLQQGNIETGQLTHQSHQQTESNSGSNERFHVWSNQVSHENRVTPDKRPKNEEFFNAKPHVGKPPSSSQSSAKLYSFRSSLLPDNVLLSKDLLQLTDFHNKRSQIQQSLSRVSTGQFEGSFKPEERRETQGSPNNDRRVSTSRLTDSIVSGAVFSQVGSRRIGSSQSLHPFTENENQHMVRPSDGMQQHGPPVRA